METLSEVSSKGAEFLLEGFLPIPKRAVTLLSASGGTGKTRLSLVMADKHIQETGEKVALWLTEDFKGQVRHTFDELVKSGICKSNSMDNIRLILNQPPQLAKRENGLFKANYKAIEDIGKALVLDGISFAVFDPLLAFYGGNENDNSEARVFIQTFAEWAKVSEITTLIIHHSNKEGGSRGATAFHDGVRCRYELNIIEDERKHAAGYREVILKKDNWGAKVPFWKLYGEDPAYIRLMPPLDKTIYVKEYEYKMEGAVL